MQMGLSIGAHSCLFIFAKQMKSINQNLYNFFFKKTNVNLSFYWLKENEDQVDETAREMFAMVLPYDMHTHQPNVFQCM